MKLCMHVHAYAYCYAYANNLFTSLITVLYRVTVLTHVVIIIVNQNWTFKLGISSKMISLATVAASSNIIL